MNQNDQARFRNMTRVGFLLYTFIIFILGAGFGWMIGGIDWSDVQDKHPVSFRNSMTDTNAHLGGLNDTILVRRLSGDDTGFPATGVVYNRLPSGDTVAIVTYGDVMRSQMSKYQGVVKLPMGGGVTGEISGWSSQIDSSWTIDTSRSLGNLFQLRPGIPVSFDRYRLDKDSVSDSEKFEEERIDTVVMSNSYGGRPITYHFVFKSRNQHEYWRNLNVCQLWMIPYQGLNDKARRELDEGRKYILNVWTTEEGQQLNHFE